MFVNVALMFVGSANALAELKRSHFHLAVGIVVAEKKDLLFGTSYYD